MISTCSYCRKAQDNDGAWLHLDKYLSKRTNLTFTHGICDACIEQHFPEVLDACMAYLQHLFGAYLAEIAEGQEDLLTPYCRKFAEQGRGSTASDFVDALGVSTVLDKVPGTELKPDARQVAVKRFLDNLSVGVKEESHIISLAYQAQDPERALSEVSKMYLGNPRCTADSRKPGTAKLLKPSKGNL